MWVIIFINSNQKDHMSTNFNDKFIYFNIYPKKKIL